MKPLHAEIMRVRRCPCCQSKYNKGRSRKHGKTAARMKAKRNIIKELSK